VPDCRGVGRGLEAADIADLNGDAGPEAGADAGQAGQDRRLGEGEKSPPDVRAELFTSSQDTIELSSQLGHDGRGGVRAGDGRRLGLPTEAFNASASSLDRHHSGPCSSRRRRPSSRQAEELPHQESCCGEALIEGWGAG
jgi:hypothetical protein